MRQPSRRARAAPRAPAWPVAQTSFSQRGIQERGDTRGWTETPQQKLLRLSAAASAQQLAAPPPEAMAAATKSRAAAGMVDAYNAATRGHTLLEQHEQRLAVGHRPLPCSITACPPYNAGQVSGGCIACMTCIAVPSTSDVGPKMVGEHGDWQQDEKRQRKKEKKRKAEDSGAAEQATGGHGESWVGSHPWRPFDREKDLSIGPKPVSREEIMKKAGTLGSRFLGNASGGRSFL